MCLKYPITYTVCDNIMVSFHFIVHSLVRKVRSFYIQTVRLALNVLKLLGMLELIVG